MKQEPVAWIYRHKKNKIQDLTSYQRTFDSEVIEEIPLYTASKELSDEEIKQMYRNSFDNGVFDFYKFAKAILKKASEK